MSRWLRPSAWISRTQAAGLGSVALLLTAALATIGGVVTDGALDIHYLSLTGTSDAMAPRWLANLIQGVVNLGWLSIALWIGARAIQAKARFVDLGAHLALARWPLVPMTAYLALPPVAERMQTLSIQLLEALPEHSNHAVASPTGLLPAMELMAWSLPVLAGLGWMIWLMFDAYRHVTQTRLAPTVTSFIVAVLAAEFLSKLTIF